MSENTVRVIHHRDPGDEQATEPCRQCSGVGRIAKPLTTRVFIAERCPTCKGEGLVPYWSRGACQ